jgi:hypothetical protein
MCDSSSAEDTNSLTQRETLAKKKTKQKIKLRSKNTKNLSPGSLEIAHPDKHIVLSSSIQK